jgi:hypothetical protein
MMFARIAIEAGGSRARNFGIFRIFSYPLPN